MNNRPKTPHGFARLIIGDGSAVSEQKNIIWNMIGSFLYAFASMVLSIAVVQLAGEDAGGVFTSPLQPSDSTCSWRHTSGSAVPDHGYRGEIYLRRLSGTAPHHLRSLRSLWALVTSLSADIPLRRQLSFF